MWSKTYFRARRRWLTALAGVAGAVLGVTLAIGPGRAHDATTPSVHDVVAGFLRRIRGALPVDDLTGMTVERALALLTPAERQVLATAHLVFEVDGPVTLGVVRDVSLKEEPFWLKDQGFVPTPARIKHGESLEFDIWEKTFPAGHIGLGVNSLSGSGEHYFVLLKPTGGSGPVAVREIYPGQARVGVFEPGVQPYVDREETLTNLPPAWVGSTIIRTERARRTDARVTRVFTKTDHPSAAQPGPVVLTWAGDPRTTQAIQWRTSADVKRGVVTFAERAAWNRPRGAHLVERRARTERIETPNVVNDPVMHWHTVQLTGLKPGTAYVYSVGDGSRNGWTEFAEFRTAPAGVEPFAFVYMGDAQNGLDRWGSLIQTAYRQRPDVAFYIMAGDLVNRGAERDDWDSMLWNARGVYDRRVLVPALGNHECQGGRPDLYLKFFDLPRNGPQAVEPERAYTFHYGNAFFAVLDSNLKPETQTDWLDAQLAATKARWKFVTYHHPLYSSGVKRDNKALREAWAPVFDRHHVDLALQGHDHAYLRTWPMHGNQRVKTPKEGTVYVVSVSGTKFYAQDPRDYTEIGFTNVATFQVLDIQVSGDRLHYRAYDGANQLRDELVIEK